MNIEPLTTRHRSANRCLTTTALTVVVVLCVMIKDSTASTEAHPVRGVVNSAQSANLALDFSSRVISVHRRIGESFEKGDVLIKFDCREQQARHRSARANLAARDLEFQNQRELAQLNSAGRIDVELARAERDAARAAANEVATRLDKCQIKAPYRGKVAELGINDFETVKVNEPFMRIVNSTEHELNLIVPSLWLSWIKPGTPFTFGIDETGRQYQASVERIGAEVDAVSRTVTVIGKFIEGSDNLDDVLPGMSGTAAFQVPD